MSEEYSLSSLGINLSNKPLKKDHHWSKDVGIIPRNSFRNKAKNKNSVLKEEEIINQLTNIIEVSQLKSNMFMEHVNNMSSFLKIIYKNIENVDLETNKIKKKFGLYDMEQKKYLGLNVTLENELEVLKSSVFTNYDKQKKAYNDLKEENIELQQQLKVYQEKNEALLRFKEKNNQKLIESICQIRSQQMNTKEIKEAFEEKINFYEEKIIKMTKQFETEITKIKMSHQEEIEKKCKIMAIETHEVPILYSKMEKLKNENIEVNGSKNIFSNETINQLIMKKTSLKKENISLWKRNKLQNISITHLIEEIRELQSQVQSIDPKEFLVNLKESNITKESNQCNKQCDKELENYSVDCQRCHKCNLKRSKNIKFKADGRNIITDGKIFKKETSREKKPFSYDMERGKEKWNAANLYSLDYIKENGTQ